MKYFSIIYVGGIAMLAAISIVISGSCATKTKPHEQLREYRNRQGMNEVVVNAEGHKCINKSGVFRVNKKFGLDGLPVVYSWSCEYQPEEIHND